MARKRRRSRKSTCKKYKVRCGGRTYLCHRGSKHQKGMYCRLVSKKRRSRKRR